MTAFVSRSARQVACAMTPATITKPRASSVVPSNRRTTSYCRDTGPRVTVARVHTDFHGVQTGKLHKRETPVCILTADGELTERRIATTRERFTAVPGSRPPARMLIEASTESEWVARHLEMLAHDVIVADQSYALMYARRSRRDRASPASTDPEWPKTRSRPP